MSAHVGLTALVAAFTACAGAGDAAAVPTPVLPLVLVADVPLPGGAKRFDYQDVDPARGRLVIAHMSDNSVLFADLADGHVVAQFPQIPVARGVVVASELGLAFVTSSPSTLVILDETAQKEVRRVPTGSGPDGVGWDPKDQIVGVSDQHDGALSLIASAGSGARAQIPLGSETGNVVFDPTRGRFWITAEQSSGPDQLVGVDPVAKKVVATIALPGCSGAHGLRLHPDAQSAFIACERNDRLVRVGFDDPHAMASEATGSGADVLALDPGLGLLYVAAESGDVTVFDTTKPGVVLLGHAEPGPNAHTVAVDPKTHHVFFPLMKGPDGTPVLRIMRPSSVP